MPLTLYSHPFSSYCQKVLVALWENDTPFTYRHLWHEGAEEERAALWPLGRFPVLVDDDRTVVESSIIIEHLDNHHPGPVRFLPDDRESALEVRFMDRFFDNYVMTPVQRTVSEAARPVNRKDEALEDARQALEQAYAWLEHRLGGQTWAAGEEFTMADCAAAPSLFYADWVHEIGDFPRVRKYRDQLLARPSFARAVDEGREYRSYFPLSVPGRD